MTPIEREELLITKFDVLNLLWYVILFLFGLVGNMLL